MTNQATPETVERNFEARTLFHGDNLPFLRGMNSGTVNLIATDPPFNKSKDFHATPDSLASGARFVDRWSWDRDVHPEWVDAIQDDWPAAWFAIDNARMVAGEDMGAFLCWLGVRLMEMHRVLADDGSIYLHIDHTAHAYVKTLMDGIFGRDNFRNEIIWAYGQSARGAKAVSSQFARNHDTILFYSKSSSYRFNRVEVFDRHAINRLPSYIKVDGSGAFKTSPRGDYTDASIERLESEGRIYRTSTGTIRIKYPPKIEKGYVLEPRTVGSSWSDIPDMMHVPMQERTGFPTQKPLALYERIIDASSDPGDMVLDPFCGCATTPIAAERHGRQWVGMDIWDGALGQVQKRMENNRQLLSDANPQVHYATAPPVRTDDQKVAAPTLRLKNPLPSEPPGPKMTNAAMKARLVENDGMVCAGCERTFDDIRYLQLDHNTPRSQGGLNHISNRMLLCGPCNLAKSNTLTLEGLRRLNRTNGWMAHAG